MRIRVTASLLFLSGLTALVYQVVWIKQLGLVVGVDVYAVSTGVSAFFAGLALGSALFGRLADRMERPLRLYGLLEVGIALAGVGSTFLLARSPAWFVFLESAAGPLAWALPFALVALPATLMGGTLPPMLATLRPDDDHLGQAAGRLYAANTAGAIAGALLAVFVLIPEFGIQGAAHAAAALNVVLAVVALWLASTSTGQSRNPDTAPSTPSGESRLALALYALAGGVALGYEVLWSQAVVQFLSTRAMAFSVVLATFLLGLVAGSWIYARYADRVSRRWLAFGGLIAGAGLAAMGSFALLGAWLPEAQNTMGDLVKSWTDSRALEMAARFALASGVLILPATVLLGAAFPAATRLIVDAGHPGRDVGLVLAINTAAGIIGTLLTGFVLLPWLGLAGSLGVLAAIAALIGGTAIAKQGSFRIQSAAWGLAVLAVAVLVGSNLPRDRLATLLADARGGDVLFYDEGPGGTVAVIEQQTPRGAFRRLYIQGVSNSGDVMPSKRYMRLQALLPLIVHPGEPRSAAVIAFGTGITAGSLLIHPGLERRLAIELLEPVIDAAPLFEGNFAAGRDPRLVVVIADGRHELMRREESFDLITLEPPPPAAAGVVNLYSTDFYELALSRLEPDGLLTQWLPIATQNEEDTQSLIRSMLDVFPHVSLWTTEVHEMMLIGSRHPLELDFDRTARRMADPDIAKALREIGINGPADLLATYITGETGLAKYTAGAAPVTDDRPRIEYAPWVRPREIVRVLPAMLALGSPLPLTATPEQVARVEQSYLALLTFYEAAWRSYGSDRERWSDRLAELQGSWPSNAYFDWFLGDPRSHTEN